MAAADYPTSNVRNYLLYGNDSSLSGLGLVGPEHQPDDLFDPGGEDTGVSERWKDRDLEVKKFIDNVSGSENINANLTYRSRVTSDTEERRYIHAPQSQELFDKVSCEASSKGMKLNEKKTTLLCISAACSYEPRTFIKLGSNDVILSGKSMKLLGFHFDTRPSVDAHVSAVLRKVRYRTWSIHNLKRLGLSTEGLVTVYKSLVRPCFDYACIVYHSLLSKSLSESLEKQQQKILKIIYGYDISLPCRP